MFSTLNAKALVGGRSWRIPRAALRRNLRVRCVRMSDGEKKRIIGDAIRGVPNFPKPGILFWDISTLLLDCEGFKCALDLMQERYKDKGIEAVAALESRGFVFGAPLALALQVPLVLMRKPNKLPGS